MALIGNTSPSNDILRINVVGERLWRRISQSKGKLNEASSIRELAEAGAENLENLIAGFRGVPVAQPDSQNLQKKSRLTAKQIYDARRMADKITSITGFSASLAFDTLLDLHINAAAERPVSVFSACTGAACPPSTALRWVHFPVQKGLVYRAPDPLDPQRAYLSLTQEGAAKIEKAIAHYGSCSPIWKA